ncbi:MAG: hypothetical protein OHK0017_06310 [Patescibacteria group bacterium]
MTLMNKILGRNYKWWYFMVYTFRLNTAYLVNEIFSSLNRTVSLLASLIIFTVLEPQSSEIITYLLIGNLYFASTDANNSWFVGNLIKEGKLSKVLLLPSNFHSYVFYTGISNTIYMLLTYLASLLPLTMFFGQNLVFSWNILWLFVLWPIAVVIRLFCELITGLTAFWTTEFYGAAFLNITFLMFFSGSMFPLNYISDKYPLLNHTPFAVLFYHPMQIYLGKYGINQIAWIILEGITWGIILFTLSILILRYGRRKYESVGL